MSPSRKKSTTAARAHPKGSSAAGALPLPRNAVELPIYGFLKWEVWTPVQLVLGVPYRDLDDRFATQRLAAVAPVTRGALDPQNETALTTMPDAADETAADFAVSVERPVRRGPPRASDSMQLVIDIGLDQPGPALAMILLWRDEAIIKGQLGIAELENQASRWWRSLGGRATKIRKQRGRLKEAGGTGAAPWMPDSIDGMRRAAMICARGTASRCGGADAEALVRAALARYGKYDPLLGDINLPKEDHYRYHHDVRDLVHHFVAVGGMLADYSEERTHVLVRGQTRPEADDAGEIDL